MSKKTIKIRLNANTEKEVLYRNSYDLGTLIGTMSGILKYTDTSEEVKRLILRSLREIEHGDSEYSKSKIKQLEELADGFGFEFES
jgi:hypothetical protein